ncbi:hypothetical protein FUAX_15840 [Fulvitalea axinellae]|uniref:N-acetyltransferase domain-containing protein n=1 Tax=Fulvitalea axinellae TaxID=1182444 RepID=A0AAU9CQC1_9BACT|nr:hypothetical protein FUAX_15840 [Fulvitalea axinellae]
MKTLQIVNFDKRYAKDFEALNTQWLAKYFYVEEYDKQVLSNPEEYIIRKGGHIFMATIEGKAIGTVALINRDNNTFELSKMAVEEEAQGMRIGQKLMYYAINFAGENNIDRLFLDSNTILKPAISLYKKVGFKEIPVPKNTPYERCNIRMELMI